MIQLTLNSIKALADNDRLFRDGFMIHQKNQITSIRPSSKNGFKVTITDSDGQDFNTSLYFYKDTGTYKHAKCSCHEAMPCRHTIAALINILYKKDTLSLELKNNHTLKMFESFESLLIHTDQPNKQALLHLEITLTPRDSHSLQRQTSLTLKAGPSQLYIVKNIESFVRAVFEKKAYPLSKNYSLKQNSYQFSETDGEIINLLYDYYETRAQVTPSAQAHLLTPTKAANLTLPGTYLKRLLTLLDEKAYNIDYDGFTFKQQMMTDQVEIDFFLGSDTIDYTISVNTYDIFFPVTMDFTYVFYNNQLSHLDKPSAKAFNLFYHYFNDKLIDIADNQLDDFINRILPVLEMIGYVHIEDAISEKITTYPLTCRIQIDKIPENIALSAVYTYGDQTIELYPSKPFEDEAIVLRRNIEKEHIIESLLGEAEKIILPDGRLSYANEEALFQFIDQVIPRLVKHADVFYSEDFKHTYLRSDKQLSTAIRYNNQLNLLDLDFELEGVEPGELRDLINAVIAKKNYFKLSDGSFYAIDNTLQWQIEQIDNRFALNLDDPSKPLVSANTYNALYLDHILGSDRANTSYDSQYRRLLEAIHQPSDEDFPVPDLLSATLRSYQSKGYTWLRSLAHYGLGGILADDMGLGKTLQAIALMIDEGIEGPSLVVAPTSLLYNWEEEVHKFLPNVQTRVVAGTKQERTSLISAIADRDIVITSYGALKRDLQLYTSVFEYCIIDEAQHIKNPRSLNAQAVKAINAKYRFALTGTPIENTLTELWSIFDFILPGYLGDYKHFITNYEKPIIKDNNHAALEQLGMLISPFILRRLKEEVLDELPPKIETKVSVELNKHQKKLYMAYVNQAKGELRAYDNMPKGQRSMKILSVLMRLRQICCHPSLFVENYDHQASKMELLMELVEESIEGNHRILIFSQFTSMLKMISQRLEDKHIEHYYLDGSVPPIKRQQMVHDFNSGTNPVFLISLKAGGTGLNLTGADVVIHYDPWWNPAVENQATDRAYRIGQKKCVQVYKLITAGTIEEKIFQLQKRKEGLIDNVIKPGETFINKLSATELEQLFDL